ncbi:MAG: class I adenylate-forming enzyme family protein [Proteobacteria bacterium]|nr:class I adenylate-forming enzyme family protein [Pseudomonadota bacterium]
MTVGPDPSTLAGFIRHAAASHPDADAVVLAGSRISYSQLLSGATTWALRLVALGVRPGEHVGLLLPNSTEFMQVLFGVALAGAVSVPLNSRYRGPEIAATVADADLVAIVTTCEAEGHPSFTERLREAFPDLATQADSCRLALLAAPKLRSVVALDNAVEPGLLRASEISAPPGMAAELEARRLTAQPSATAIILYTSGSTSRPKGCLLSHAALLTQGQLMAGRYNMTANDRIWSPVPMFHVGGISPFIAIASVGGAFLSMPRIEPGAGLALMAAERATICYVLFQTIITDLLQHPHFESFDLSAVRLVISNLALQPLWIAELLAKRMPLAIQIGTYGMTETVGAACTHSPHDEAADRLGRLGRTGGSIMFHGRLKDVLKVGGENVGALEVETVVGDHPAVKGCAVIGMADPRLVEVPVVFVELAPGRTATEQDILEFCVGKLASFKLPRRAFFLTEWPMSSTKIDKPALRLHVAQLVESDEPSEIH